MGCAKIGGAARRRERGHRMVRRTRRGAIAAGGKSPARWRGLVLALMTVAVGLSFPIGPSPHRALAAAGTPGVPQPAVVVFSEDFANNVGTTPVSLASYVGATGQTYTA